MSRALLSVCFMVMVSMEKYHVLVASLAYSAILISVDLSGRGDFTSIQEAIDAVPSNNSDSVFISITPGIYREKIIIPADKPFITLSGKKARSTIITWDEGWVTSNSPSLTVLASDFVGRFLTIQNTYGSTGQAIAARVSGDRVAFYGCRFFSFQDTLLDDTGRHYYSNCYIKGATDFICGNALSLFEKCHLHSVSENGGAVTAQRRMTEEEETGFSFVGCKVTGTKPGSLLLGRPWGSYSRVVFALSYMSNAVRPKGWNNWDNPANERQGTEPFGLSNVRTVYYGQYKCYGPGSKLAGRVPWSHRLSSADAAHFMSKSMINGQDWLRPAPTSFRKVSTDRPSLLGR